MRKKLELVQVQVFVKPKETLELLISVFRENLPQCLQALGSEYI